MRRGRVELSARLFPIVGLAAALACGLPAGAQAPGGPGFAFVDPQLTVLREAEPGRNPMYRDLTKALADYRTVWGGLPQTKVPAGPALGHGDAGPRVTALRQRFGIGPGSYDGRLAGLVASFQMAHGLTASGRADAETLAALNRGSRYYEGVIQANIERARVLPPRLGDRYILVDAVAGRMSLVERGRQTAGMKVVIGKPSQPTPVMAAIARYLVFNPYWNVPEDLVRTSIAPKVLSQGLSYIRNEGLEVLSDYTDDAVELDPAKVDWRAVARGQTEVRVRQRPGPKNMMGQVKLMLPNPLGVYLHDTPLRGDFARSERLASSGCVRLEDAISLARALVGEREVRNALDGSGQERRVDLKRPIPVYITYFTVEPRPGGVYFRPDVYGRDREAVRQIAGRDNGAS